MKNSIRGGKILIENEMQELIEKGLVLRYVTIYNLSDKEINVIINRGDEITLEIKLNDNIIEDLAFTGQGCAISQASTSMMIDLLKGKDKEEALKLVETFIGMIKREINDEEQLEELEDAIVLKNISNMPARVKCAVLAWHTIKEAMEKDNK